MESSKEQDILEAAAFHLILLSNSLKRSYNHINEDDSDDGSDPGGGGDGGFGLMKKKKKQDCGVKGIVNHNNYHSTANSLTSSSSSLFSGSMKSGISMQEVHEEENERKGRRWNRHRLRSIVDIYNVTRPL